MKAPKITIVTPSFNQGGFLEETILSILNQKYENLEYIIIDGGSTDNSVEIIRKYEKDIAYWVSEKDEGQTQAINKGFQKATGDLVGWMNSDDVYYEKSLNKIGSAFLETKGKFDVYFGDQRNIDVNGMCIKNHYYPPFSSWGIKHTTNMNISNQSAFWRRGIFEETGYLDESIQFAMDYEFFMRLSEHKYSFHHIPYIMGGLRMYEDNKSSLEEWIKIKFENIDEINSRYGVEKSIVKKTIYYVYKAFHLLKNRL